MRGVLPQLWIGPRPKFCRLAMWKCLQFCGNPNEALRTLQLRGPNVGGLSPQHHAETRIILPFVMLASYFVE